MVFLIQSLYSLHGVAKKKIPTAEDIAPWTKPMEAAIQQRDRSKHIRQMNLHDAAAGLRKIMGHG